MIAFAELSWFKLRSSTSLIKRQHSWPEPEQSTGTHFCRMGKNECWEAIGPAGQMYKELSRDIRKLLEERVDYINEGEPVLKMITFRLYMTGRRKSCARPTVMICCERPIPRHRTRELIKESAILDKYPGVILGDSSHPPDFDRPPIQLTLDNLGIDAYQSATDTRMTVFCGPSQNLCGLDIFIMGNGSSAPLRKATIGGILRSEDRYFALTVAHAFGEVGISLEPPKAVELEFDIDEQSNSDTEDDDFIEATSGGSMTPDSATVGRRFAPYNFHSGISLIHRSITPSLNSIEDNDTMVPATTKKDASMPLLISGGPGAKQDDVIESSLQILGLLVMSSLNGLNPSLDWGLVEITRPGLVMFNRILQSSDLKSPFIYPERFIRPGPRQARVLAATSSGGVISGTLSETPTFMNFPQNRVFQEVWTVSLNGKLMNGDCGSWVVDAKSGDVYGHIVAGSPDAGIAYVIPGYQIHDDIEKQFGCGLEISTRAEFSNEEGDAPQSAREEQRKPNLATHDGLSQMSSKGGAQQDTEQQRHEVSPINDDISNISHQMGQDVTSTEITEPNIKGGLGLRHQMNKPSDFISSYGEGLRSTLRDRFGRELPMAVDKPDIELGLFNDSAGPVNKRQHVRLGEGSRTRARRRTFQSLWLHELRVSRAVATLFGKQRHMQEHPSSLSEADRAARIKFFEILLTQDGAPLPLAAANPILESCMIWYAKFLECRFKGGWTTTIRGALKSLSEFSNEPQPDEIGSVYRSMSVVAKLLLKRKEELAMIEIVDELSNQGLLNDQVDWDRAIPNQLVFAAVGWLTMLYDPAPTQTHDTLEVRRSPGSTLHSIRRFRSDGTFSSYKQIGFDTFDRPMSIFLGAFGRLVPEIGVGLFERSDLIIVSHVSFSMLSVIGGVEIEWVNSLSLHLEFDNVRRVLKIFRFPSFCLLMCREVNPLSRLYQDHNRLHERVGEDLTSEYFREVLLSYRLLFGQDKASWKAMQKKLRTLTEHWDCSDEQSEDRDPMLRTLCCSSYDSPDAKLVYKEIDALCDVSLYYYPDYDFPFLGRRILNIQAFVDDRKPSGWRALWYDRRNVSWWWTFWAVLLIGGGVILLGILQIALQIWSSISA